MILLDTNVVSELMRPVASLKVIRWLDDQNPTDLYLASTALAEVLVGIHHLPDGRRKDGMLTGFSELLEYYIGGRILSFGREEAELSGRLAAKASQRGFTVSFGDGQIGAVAQQHGMTVATRDTAPFVAMGVPVIDPWG